MQRVTGLALLVAMLLAAGASAQVWEVTGSLNSGRSYHGVVLLHDGRVLAAGGRTPTAQHTSSAELFDRRTGIWKATSSMNSPRLYISPVQLLGTQSLVIGGATASESYVSTCELFDALTETWTYTGSMTCRRNSAVPILLPNGEVLIVGGYGRCPLDGGTGDLAETELYNPQNGTWRLTGTMSAGRVGHTVTLLKDGTGVLVVGGRHESAEQTAELYNITTGQWRLVATPTAPHTYHTAGLLHNGLVLVAAGVTGPPYDGRVELYNVTSNTWTITGLMPLNPEQYYSMEILDDGRAIVIGGETILSVGFESLPHVQVYNATTGQWEYTAFLHVARATDLNSVKFPDGSVMIVGGLGNDSPDELASCEVYYTGTAPTRTASATASWTQSATVTRTATASATTSPTPSCFPCVTEDDDVPTDQKQVITAVVLIFAIVLAAAVAVFFIRRKQQKKSANNDEARPLLSSQADSVATTVQTM